MVQSWTPTLNGVAGISAEGQYSQTTDADGAAVYEVWFQLTCLRSDLASLLASSPAVPLYIGGLPVSVGTGLPFVGCVGTLNGLGAPTGFSQISLTASAGSGDIGLVLTGPGIPSMPSMSTDLQAQSGPPGRGNPGNFFQIAGSITFHG